MWAMLFTFQVQTTMAAMGAKLLQDRRSNVARTVSAGVTFRPSIVADKSERVSVKLSSFRHLGQVSPFAPCGPHMLPSRCDWRIFRCTLCLPQVMAAGRIATLQHLEEVSSALAETICEVRQGETN